MQYALFSTNSIIFKSITRIDYDKAISKKEQAVWLTFVLKMDLEDVRRKDDQGLVGEWLLFNAKSAIIHLYHGENKLIFNEMMRSALQEAITLGCISIVHVHWNSSLLLCTNTNLWRGSGGSMS